jgi:tetratricopeptide (TPR) repeat protein
VVAVAAMAGAGWVAYAFHRAAQREPRPTADLGIASAHPAQHEALVLADRLLDEFPDNPEALFLRGLLLAKWEQNEEAVRCWEACLRLAPNFAAAYACIGQHAVELGEYERALVPLRKAMESNPKLPDVGLALGESLRKLGRDEEAIPILEEATATWPNSARAYLELGEAHLRLKEYEKAKMRLEKAVEIWPLSTRGYFGLMTVCTKLGDTQKAREYEAKSEQARKTTRSGVRALGTIDAGERALWRQLADSYTQVGQFYAAQGLMPEAEACWQKAAASDGKHSQSRKMLMRLYAQDGKLEQALQAVQELRQIEPQNAEYSLSSGALSAALERFDDAEAAFRKTIELAPKRTDGYASLVQLSLQTGRKLSEAKELARRAVQLQPTARHYFLLGQTCWRSGDRPGALTAIQRAIELDPGNPSYQQAYQQMRQKE